MKNFVLALATSAALVAPQFAAAEAQFDVAALQTGCTTAPASCVTLVGGLIASLKAAGYTGAALDEQLAEIAGAVIGAAKASGKNDLNNASFASALNAAAESASEGTRTGISSAANVVASGEADNIGGTGFGSVADDGASVS